MSLTELFRRDPAPGAVRVTLDDLWKEAEKYGSPKLEREHYRSQTCEASIHLRSSSSMLIVKHSDTDPIAALQGAIEKARTIFAVTKGE